jgi:hypothetical protein
VQDFDEDAPVWQKTWNRLVKPQQQAKKGDSALALIEQSQVELVPAERPPPPAEGATPLPAQPSAAAAAAAAAGPAGAAEAKSATWSDNLWKATNSIWGALQLPKPSPSTAAAAAAAPLVDVSPPASAPPLSKSKLSELPSDLFEPVKELPPPPTEQLLQFEQVEHVDAVAPEPQRPADLLMFAFDDEQSIERVKSADLLMFHM